MQYLGGKAKLGKRIARVLNALRGDRDYYEPFVGAANVLRWVEPAERRFASDAHPELIELLKAIRDGWEPPSTISEAQYAAAKRGEITGALRAFIGFGCSFGGKWFGGYARGNANRNYASNARNSLLSRARQLAKARFACRPFEMAFERKTECALIYCDPPYANTTGYSAIEVFDIGNFWDKVTIASCAHLVVVSEYQAPPAFRCILEFQTKTDIRTRRGKEPRIERLFVHKSQATEARAILARLEARSTVSITATQSLSEALNE